MQWETMAALGAGIYLSSTLPGMAQRALSRVGLNLDLTSGYRSSFTSLAMAGFLGYGAKQLLGLKPATAAAFTVAAMLPAILGILHQMVPQIPTIHTSGGPGGISGFSLAGILGNAPSVVDEPIFGEAHYDMPAASSEMFGLAGKEINLF
jgi:hypothetical protein